MEQSEILAKIDELKQKPLLNRRERRYLAKLEKKLHPSSKTAFNLIGIATKLLIVLGVIITVGAIVWYISNQPNLPPTDIQGHIEQGPPSHVSDREMPEPIQKHMLEHADGKGIPGIITQYNCKKYSCEKDLITKLKALVKKYPENVYLAPGNYDGKIILTRFGKREILEKYDEKKIADFINNL